MTSSADASERPGVVSVSGIAIATPSSPSMQGLTKRLGVQWARVLGLIRLRPYDTSTSEGRASERQRRVALSALASALAKAISVTTALISVPLTLHYLGPERYGMWMAISSLLAVLGFADLGIGNGMLNAIAAAHGRDDRAAIREYISSAFFMLSLIGASLALLFAVAYSFVPWAALFNVKSEIARHEAGPAVAVLVGCFVVGVPISIVQRAQVALQRGFLASLWQCLASTVGLVGVVVAIYFQAGLPWLVLAFMGTPLLAAILNSLVFFGYMQPSISPRGSAVSRATGTYLVRTGGLFLILQLVGVVAYASDSLIIAQLLGASAVAEYSVPERMFSLITSILAMMLAPLWPAYGEAIARGDKDWVRRTLRRSVITAMGFSAVFSFALVLLGPWLIQVWVGTLVMPSVLLLLGLAVWKTIEAGGNALAMFLNGAHVVTVQVAMATVTAAAALTLKIVLVQHIGVSGAVWATVLAYSLFTAIPLLILLPRLIRSAS